jgi:hypothetical protein
MDLTNVKKISELFEKAINTDNYEVISVKEKEKKNEK